MTMRAVLAPHIQNRTEALARHLAMLDDVDPDQKAFESRSVAANGPLVVIGEPVAAWLHYAHRAAEILSFIESGGLKCRDA